MKKHPLIINKLIATAMGLGYSPKAPGTAGALGGLLVAGAVMHWTTSPNIILIMLTLIFFILGVICSDNLEPIWGKDPSRIVIDEVIGMWIALLFIPMHWITIMAAFILFRFFDIYKPLYIRRMEDLKGGWGVMMDDVLAGIYANICIQLGTIIFFCIYK